MDADELAARLGTGTVEGLVEGLLESLPDAVYVVDQEGRILYANAVATAVLGYGGERELLGRPSHATIHHTRPDGSPFPEEECPLLRPPRTGATVRVDEDWFVRRDGSMVPVAYGSAPVALPGGTGAVVVFHDVTERLRADELERHRIRSQEVHASRARIVAAADSERRRLARDLHDGAQQRLVTIGMALDLALSGQDTDLAVARDELRLAVEDLRRLARGLHPSVLEHRGLHAAIASLTASSPLPVTLDVPEERFPAAVEVALYFVVAEALANVVKHAAASAATVTVDVTVDRIRATIADDGRGGADVVPGGGLAGLSDRIAALDGTLEVRSHAGGGTTVMVALPSSSGQ